MSGVLVNTGAVLIGSLIGLLVGKGIPERVSKAVMTAIGLCTIYIGVSGALQGQETIVLIISIVLGTIIGTLIDIDKGIQKTGDFFERKFPSKNKKVNITEGFMTGSMLFCIGAMTVIGSVNAGLRGDNELLYTKSILDCISSCMLAGTLGIGVMFAAVFVLVFEGGLVLLSGLLQNVLTDGLIVAEIVSAGSIMIIGIGLNLIGVTKIQVANMLPAIFLVPGVYMLVKLLPI